MVRTSFRPVPYEAAIEIFSGYLQGKFERDDFACSNYHIGGEGRSTLKLLVAAPIDTPDVYGCLVTCEKRFEKIPKDLLRKGYAYAMEVAKQRELDRFGMQMRVVVCTPGRTSRYGIDGMTLDLENINKQCITHVDVFKHLYPNHGKQCNKI